MFVRNCLINAILLLDDVRVLIRSEHVKDGIASDAGKHRNHDKYGSNASAETVGIQLFDKFQEITDDKKHKSAK